MRKRVEYIEREDLRGKTIQRFEILLGEVVYVLRPEAAIELAGWIMSLARENGHLGPEWHFDSLEELDPSKVWFLTPTEELTSEPRATALRQGVIVFLAGCGAAALFVLIGMVLYG